MATVKCKCGNTYFAKVNVNQFTDYPVTLNSTMREVEIDHDIKIYQCISCSKYMLPPTNYHNTTADDKELYAIIDGALRGEVIEKKPRHRPKGIHAGTARFIGGEKVDDDKVGKLVPLG